MNGGIIKALGRGAARIDALCVCGWIAALLSVASTSASPPTMLIDANTAPTPYPSNSSISVAGVIGSRCLYFAGTGTSGVELWSTDGTAAGTFMVRDIRPGAGSFSTIINENPPYYSTATLGGEVFFGADDGTGVRQLWATDGTTAGTRVVKTRCGPIQNVLASNGQLFMDGVASNSNNTVLWVSDGTAANTREIVAFKNAGAYEPRNFQVFGDGVIFLARRDSTSGKDLWKSDGTEAGTYIIIAGTSSSNSILDTPAVLDSQIIFSQTSPYGFELWASDGTAGNATFLKDVWVGSSGSYPLILTTVGSQVFFRATTSAGDELWVTDGTASGTMMVKDIRSGSQNGMVGDRITAFNGRALFNANDGNGTQLWISDGTEAGTSSLGAARDYEEICVVGSFAYFRSTTSSQGRELWRTDGTLAGTSQVADIATGAAGSDPTAFGAFGSLLAFSADDGVNGRNFWMSDGTAAGTAQVFDLSMRENYGSSVKQFFGVNGRAVFTVGYRLWGSDGTTAGTAPIMDFQSSGIPPSGFCLSGNRLYFRAKGPGSNDPTLLWMTDGTTQGTNAVSAPIYYSVQNDAMAPLGSGVVFNGLGSGIGLEPFISDGTANGTLPLKDIASGGQDSNPNSFFTFNNHVLFFATTPGTGYELWTTDGTSAGTVLVSDIYPGTQSSVPSNQSPAFCQFAGFVYFQANDGQHGRELWRTDGTPAGTSLVADLIPGSGDSFPNSLVVMGGSLYVLATDPAGGAYSLYKSNGTAAGTEVVAYLPDPGYYAVLLDLKAASDCLYFRRYSTKPGSPVEMWRSDGTSAGTMKLCDIAPNADILATGVIGTTLVDDVLYFPAYTPETGIELNAVGRADTSPSPIEIIPGPMSSIATIYGQSFAGIGHYLYFTADDGVHSIEPWTYLLPTRPYCPADVNHDDFVNGDDYDAFAEGFENGDLSADFNDDGFVNGDDYDAFAEAFEAGC